MIPALVVPPVATTPITSSADGSAARAARSWRRSSDGRRWAQECFDPDDVQGRPTEAGGVGTDGDARPRRAATLAVGRGVAGHHQGREVPADPPATKQPPALGGGRPTRPGRPAPGSRRPGPAASSQDVPCREEQETTMSKRSAALVGAAGMNDRKRGLSHDTTASASRPNTSSTSAGSFPSAPTTRRGPCRATPWRRRSRAAPGRGPSGAGSSRAPCRRGARRRRTSGCACVYFVPAGVDHQVGTAGATRPGARAPVGGVSTVGTSRPWRRAAGRAGHRRGGGPGGGVGRSQVDRVVKKSRRSSIEGAAVEDAHRLVMEPEL